MKKQKIQFIGVLCILVLCIAGYFLAKDLKTKQEKADTEDSAKTNVTQVTEDDVVKMEYLYDGKNISLVKKEDTWYDEADQSIVLSQSDINGMLSYACNITASTVIDEPESLDSYGLSNPSNTISLTLSDGSVVQILIGDYLDITGEYYAMIPGDSNVYTVSSYVATSFEKSIEDLLDTTDATTEETATEETTTEE